MKTTTDNGKTFGIHISHVAPRSHLTERQQALYDKYGHCTSVTITDEAGQTLGDGVAVLHEADNYCRRTGLRLAMGRALESAGLDRMDRTAIWRRVRR